MRNKNIDPKLIETFVYDCERLFLLNFDNTEYEINQTSLTVRKLLVDSGLMFFWNFFFDDKLRLVSGTPEKQFNKEYLEKIKIYIPLLDILPKVVITNFTSIKLNELPGPHTYTTESPEIKINLLSVDKYLMEGFVIIDSEYISRKDILEFVGYGTGAIHYNIKKNKVDRIKKVKKLSFHHAMGVTKPDSMFFFTVSYRTAEEEIKLRTDPDESKFMMTLGDRHGFESLMILQIVHEIRASSQKNTLYVKAKENLKENVFKYKNYDTRSYFTLIDMEKNKNAH